MSSDAFFDLSVIYEMKPPGLTERTIDTGEVLLGDLARNGFTVTEDRLEADCIVVNTCAFVEDAKAESLEVRHVTIRSPAACEQCAVLTLTASLSDRQLWKLLSSRRTAKYKR